MRSTTDRKGHSCWHFNSFIYRVADPYMFIFNNPDPDPAFPRKFGSGLRGSDLAFLYHFKLFQTVWQCKGSPHEKKSQNKKENLWWCFKILTDLFLKILLYKHLDPDQATKMNSRYGTIRFQIRSPAFIDVHVPARLPRDVKLNLGERLLTCTSLSQLHYGDRSLGWCEASHPGIVPAAFFA